MADVPRRDLKTAPALRDAAAGAKQASPLAPTDGASLDTFNSFVKNDSRDVAAPAEEVTGGAAAAAEGAHAAAQARFEPAIDRDLTEGSTGATVEASSSLADRLNVSTTEMFGRVGEQIIGRDAGMGEEQDAPAALRDSGRDALAAQVDDAFAVGDDAAASGDGIGRRGTPADLGVSGDFGTKAGLDQGSGGGLDLFDVSIPNRGVSGAANDLGLMQGITDGATGDYSMSVAIGAADEGAPRPKGAEQPPTKVTQIDTIPDGEPVPEPDGRPIEPTVVVEEALRSVAEAVEAAAPYLITAAVVAAAAAAAPAAAVPAAAAALLAISASDETGASDGKAPDATNPGREGSGIIAPPTPEQMAVRAAARERLGLGSPGSGDIDPTDEGNESVPSVGPEPGAMVFLQAGLANKATREFLFGQPTGPEAGVRGGGAIDLGNLPGDMGNIDYGPDSTGAWSGNTMTESEGDALSSFGGSGLSISDANRNDDEEEDTDDDDTN